MVYLFIGKKKRTGSMIRAKIYAPIGHILYDLYNIKSTNHST